MAPASLLLTLKDANGGSWPGPSVVCSPSSPTAAVGQPRRSPRRTAVGHGRELTVAANCRRPPPAALRRLTSGSTSKTRPTPTCEISLLASQSRGQPPPVGLGDRGLLSIEPQLRRLVR